MAELSVEEAQRLARNFLTGLAGDAEVGRLESALADDQTLALELLAQMQTALDDVAPEGLTQDQVKSVDARVEALVAPRVRRRGLFGIFKRLFKRRRKAAPARVARRAGAPEPAPAPPPPPPAPVMESPALPDGDGMEEMAPIAAAPLPSEALAHMGMEEPPPRRAAAPVEAAEPAPGVPWMGLLLFLVALGLAVGGGAWAWARHRRHSAPAAPAPATTLAPTPSTGSAQAPLPTPKGPSLARRGSVMGTKNGSDTLPAAIPPTTPQAAGQLP